MNRTTRREANTRMARKKNLAEENDNEARHNRRLGIKLQDETDIKDEKNGIVEENIDEEKTMR